MSSYLIELNGKYFRGLESYQPDYGGYQFRRRSKPVWGTKDQAMLFPSYKSASRCLRRYALALGAKIWPVEGDRDLDPFFTESLDSALHQAATSPHFVVVESRTESQRYCRWVVTAPDWSTIDGIKVSLKLFSDVWLDTAPPGEDHRG